MSIKLAPQAASAMVEMQKRVDAVARSVARLKTDTPVKTAASSPSRPAPSAAVAVNSFGFTDAPGIVVRREKADEVRTVLPEAMATWAERLTFAEQEALAAVQRLYDANGRVPVAIPRLDLAAHLRTTPEEAEALLNKLALAGAVTRSLRFQSSPRYSPVAAPPAPKRAMKTDDGKRADPSALPRLRSTLGLRPR